MAKPLVTDALWERISSPAPAPAQAEAARSSRPPTHRGPDGSDRHLVRPQDRNQLGGSSGRNGLRLWYDVLAPPARLGGGWRLGQAPRGSAGRAGGGWPDRLEPSAHRQQLGAGLGRRRRDWAQPRGSAKEREQTPRDYRRPRGSPHRNDDSGERPRRGADGGTGRCDPAGAWQAGSAAPTAAGPLRRPRLRFRPASPPLAPARHSAPDRPAEDVARQRIGEISLVRGADVVVAARFRKTARPQGSNPGYPSGVSQTCLRDNLS